MKLLTFFLISLVLGFLYFDTELTQYGNSILNINNKLPFNALVKYRSEFEGGITILDSHGVSLVGEGVQYWESDFEVDEIIRYASTGNALIVEIIDKSKKKHYIIFEENLNSQNSQEIKAKEVDSSQFNTKEYNWVDIKSNEKYIRVISVLRNWLMVLSLLTSMIFLYKLRRRSTKLRPPSARL